MAVAKYCQGSSAVYVSTGYGTLSEGSPAKLPKISVNTIMLSRGWRMAHAAPSNVCL